MSRVINLQIYSTSNKFPQGLTCSGYGSGNPEVAGRLLLSYCARSPPPPISPIMSFSTLDLFRPSPY